MEEIERRFLVSEGWFYAVITDPTYRLLAAPIITQGYFETKDKKLAIRVRYNLKGKAWYTMKYNIDHMSSYEYEHSIDVKEAKEILKNIPHRKIVKARTIFLYKGLTWEVDAFIFPESIKDLVIAEVELDSREQEVPKHNWLGVEITGNHTFSNASMASKITNPTNTANYMK